MNQGKLVRLAQYIEVVVQPDLTDEQAHAAVLEMFWSGEADASPGDPELISITLEELDDDGFPVNQIG